MAKVLLKFNAAVIKEIPLDKDILTIGRKSDNDIVIDNPAVSGHHARIIFQAGAHFIEDLNSTNGTFIRERKIIKANLTHQDEVGIAKHSLVYINEEQAAKTAAPLPAVSSDATVFIGATPKVASAPAPSSGPKKDKIGTLKVVGGADAVTHDLTGLTTYIGKAESAQIQLKGFFAPDLACCVARQPEGYYIKIIKEKSVKVNGQTFEEQLLLKDGDLVEVKDLKLVFYMKES
ncbi:MAG TPA: FHA domain-containing protein [Elusimicrobiota bacterium]|nr:FHA domain-containing protein [Elusimicrobiota bacterium]